MNNNYNESEGTPTGPKPLSNGRVIALVVLFFFIMNGGMEAVINLAAHHGPHRENIKP